MPQDQIIYVEGKGFIPIASGQTVQQAIAATPDRARLGVSGPGDAFKGIDLPAEGMQSANADILKAMPQIAGLIAQFTPVGKAGFTGSAAVPMVVDAVQQLFSGQPFDAGRMAQEGAEGVAGHGVGRTIGWLGDKGRGIARRSLNLGSGKFAGDEVAEQLIPDRLISEKAAMTRPGVAKLQEKVDATGDPWLKDAADALKDARYKADNSPNIQSGAIMAAIMHLLDPPKQLKLGSALAEPFGVDTTKTLAPMAEGAMRTFMAALEGLMPRETPPSPAGPQRRASQ